MRRFTLGLAALLVGGACAVGSVSAETGFIQIRAAPGITVFMDGLFVGVTNDDEGGLILVGVPTGVRALRFTSEGFVPRDTQATVRAGEVILYDLGSLVPRLEAREEGDRGSVDLIAQVGSVIVQCLPVECLIDLPSMGYEGYRKTLDRFVLPAVPVGPYEGRLSHGGQTLSVSFGVCDGDTVTLFGAFVGPAQGVEVRSELGLAWPDCDRVSGDHDVLWEGDVPGVWSRLVVARDGEETVLTGLAVDAAGNVAVVGQTKGALLGEPGDAFVQKYDSRGQPAWGDIFGGSRDASALAVAVDAAGGAVVVGRVAAQQGSGPPSGSDRVYDAFVRKYDADGHEQWTRFFGANAPMSWTWARGVAVAPDGSIVVVGFTDGYLGEPGFFGDRDGFVRKYDAEGRELWTRQFGTAGRDYASSVVVDGDGSIFVLGGTDGRLATGPVGSNDIVLTQYTSGGEVAWVRQFGLAGLNQDRALALDQSGGVVVVGNEGAEISEAGPVGGIWFVRVFDGDGTVVWTSDSDGSTKTGVTVNGSEILVVGSAARAAAAGSDAHVRAFDLGGALLWARQFGTLDDAVAQLVAADANGAIYVAGLLLEPSKTGCVWWECRRDYFVLRLR